MSEIYARCKVTDGRYLVIEGLPHEDVPNRYYPVTGAPGRASSTVIGKEHLSVTPEAKEAIRRILTEGHRTGDNCGCLEVIARMSDEGDLNDVVFSWIGPLSVCWEINQVIRDPAFFLGDNSSPFILDVLTEA